MKNIKTFESFSTGFSDADILIYVNYLLSGDDFIEVFDLVGMDAPGELSGAEFEHIMSDARESAVAYYTMNQTEIDDRKMEEARYEDENY